MFQVIKAFVIKWLPFVIETATQCAMAPVYQGAMYIFLATTILFLILWLYARNEKTNAAK